MLHCIHAKATSYIWTGDVFELYEPRHEKNGFLPKHAKAKA